jgi:hypothetical protein
MGGFFFVLAAGLLGVVGHWVTRWSQGRTQSTFVEYIKYNLPSTLSSLFSILASSSIIYQAMPVDVSGRDLLLLLIGSYSSGYMLDSKVNRDKPVAVAVETNETAQEVKRDDKEKSLDSLLDDDDALGR